MKVTIVGPQNRYPERKNINIGDVLSCTKDLSDKFGKTVKVETKSGDELGYIAAKSETSINDSLLADEIFDDENISENFNVEVIDIDTIGRSKVFVCKVLTNSTKKDKKTVEKESKTMSKDKKYRTIESEVVGAKKIYPDRYYPLKKLRKVIDPNTNLPVPIPVKIEFDEENDKIIVLINCAEDGEAESWRACGHINPDVSESNSKYKTSQEVKNLISAYRVDGKDPEMECMLVKHNADTSNLTFILSLKIFGQTEIEKATENIVDELDETFYNEFKDFIENTSLSQQGILLSYQYVKNIKNSDISRIPGETVFNNTDNVLEDVLYSILSGNNTMLIGPMAAGKNTCLEMLAYKFNQALFEVQVNSYIDNDTLLGTRTIKAKSNAEERDKINAEGNKLIQALSGMGSRKNVLKSKIENENKQDEQIQAIEEVEETTGIDFSLLINAVKNGETEISFQPSAIVTAMEQGAWVVIDEFNTGQPSVMSVLNSILDDRKRIQVPGYGLVKAKETFRLFGTMNPDYEGTCVLNAATSSRFTPIEFKAAEKITPIILSRVPNATKDFTIAAEKLYTHIRNGIETGKLQSDSINVRGFINAAKIVNIGQDIKRALVVNVANGVIDTADKQNIKDFIEVNLA